MYLIKFQPENESLLWTIGYVKDKVTAKTYCNKWNKIRKTATEYYEVRHIRLFFLMMRFKVKKLELNISPEEVYAKLNF